MPGLAAQLVAQLTSIATGHRPLFEPGTSWSYPNTNYGLVSVRR
ncbi:hypothetical protein [Streptomyces sp. NPDC059639]